MTDDPIMAEVRATRDRLAARFDYDLEAIFRHVQALEASSGLTYVPCPPRRLASADGPQESGRHGQSPSKSSTASETIMRGPACDENAGTAARQEPPPHGRSHRHSEETEETETVTRRPQRESNREICFSQGKPCVYQPEDNPEVIRTEWPNGTVDEVDFARNTRRRRWPDGTTETRTADTEFPYPMWPRPNHP